MRLLPFLLIGAFIIVAIVAVAPARRAAASSAPPPATYAAAPLAQPPPRAVDDHGGSRVAVQLVVAGIAAGVVVGLGTCAYLLRRKLGLTAYTPPSSAADGHH